MNPKKHKRVKAHTRYKLADGTPCPGVTTAINKLNKPQLIFWANKLGLEGINSTKFVDELADIGNVAHEHIQAFLQKKAIDISDYTINQIESAQPCIDKFKEWYDRNEVEPILIETPLVSEQYKYGGTLDLYGKINGKLTLLDRKTGARFYEGHRIQLSANRQLLEENGHKVECCKLVSIGREEKEDFHEAEIGCMDDRFVVFRHLLGIYYKQKKLGV